MWREWKPTYRPDRMQDPSCEDLERLTEQWFGQLGEQPVVLLLGLCRQPFPELRCAALGALVEVARTRWGQAALSAQPGFIEYLLDRSTETDKRSKEAKFALLAALAEPQPRGFSAADWHRIKKAHREGPFYLASQPAVTFEEVS